MALKWTWRVAANILYTLIVWYVLSQLRGRPESLIVPILGLIYVTVRTLGMSLAQISLHHVMALGSIETQLRAITDPDHYRDRDVTEELGKMKTRISGNIVIESIGLFVLSLLCLFYHFNAIQ